MPGRKVTWYACLVLGCGQRHLTLRSLVNHMRLSHCRDRSMSLVCGLDNCQFVYNCVETFRKHVTNIHSVHWLGNASRVVSCPDVNHGCDGMYQSLEDGDELNESDEDVETAMDIGCGSVEMLDADYGRFLNEFGHKIATSQLKSRELYMLPKSAAKAINNDIHGLFDVFEENLKRLISERMNQLGMNVKADPILGPLLRDGSTFELVTQEIATEHLFKRYLAKNLGYVAPHEIVLGQSGSVKDVVHYVPVLETIKHYLEHDDVWASCNVVKPENPTVLRDYTDGQIWISSDQPGLFLRIHAYSDELEIANPLGSRKIVHKVSAFYFVLGNIETKHWSSLSNIHLLLLTKFKNVKKYGLEKILEPALKDFKILESQGMVFKVSDLEFVAKGSVVTLSGDNLSSHAIGGFNCSFSSGRFCRYCMTTYMSRSDRLSELDCELRSSEMHKKHLQLIAQDADFSAVYGVRGICPLAELEYFDPITSLVPDVMHDVFEGVMQINIEVVVRGLIVSKILTVNDINSRIASFSYSRSDKADKPILFPSDFVQKNRSISGKAVEKWCLFRLLPLLIGQDVPMENEFWTLHLLCREICAIILAPVIDLAWISYLELVIANHHRLLVKLAPAAFKPKMHFLVHYPRMMLLYGPLKFLYCMRFEAMHQYFKQMVRRVKSFKNITGTLSERFQMKACCQQQGPLCFAESIIIRSSQHAISVSSLPNELKHVLKAKHNISVHSNLVSVSRVTIDVGFYSVGSCIVLDVIHEENVPLFLKISYIFQYLGLWLLCGTIHASTSYLAHFDMFCVEATHDWAVVSPGEEIGSQLVSLYNIPNGGGMGIHVPYRLLKNTDATATS